MINTGRRAHSVTLLTMVAMVLLSLAPASAEDFTFSADSMSGAMSKGRERAVLVGNALVLSGSMRIAADRIELYGDEFRFAECSGRVLVVDEERGLRLTTERLVYDRRDKVSRLTGPSVMEDRQNKVVIKGDYIENDDERKIANSRATTGPQRRSSCLALLSYGARATNTARLPYSSILIPKTSCSRVLCREP